MTPYDVPTGRVELHCHLDGSVRPDTVAELAAEEGEPLTVPATEALVAPPVCGSLVEFLGYLDLALRVLQTPHALGRAARELVEDWHADGLVYGEVRFAPQLHQQRGMTMDDAVRAVAGGLREGAAATGVRTGLLLCCLRHQPPEVSESVVDTALRWPDLVCGVDLAGDETQPGTPHRSAFDAAHAAGLPVTIHAGEVAGPESVWEAVDVLGAARVGHGVRAPGDSALLERLRADGIALETCPTSNVQTRAVPGLARHPADALLRAGLPVTVSTDTRTTSATTVGGEFRALAGQFGWGEDEEARCQHHARAAAFGS
ncbi:adenosine deaminase [Haloactinospora alba]|uniref:adenosine deaminase n=1 Tax=Haloactinospora alba TaxID=405555 RepID=A0A543NNH8_9ACTN|nr:adenosine deaminase [Haloactinospora alba]TQN33383.1 adenosine deaminase [Haloactinospora alba]